MLPTFNLRLSKFVFDGKKYAKVLGKHVSHAMRIAAKAFLVNAISRIPVRTSFLRGAFGNLEDLVGNVITRVSGGGRHKDARDFLGSNKMIGQKKTLSFRARRNRAQSRIKNLQAMSKVIQDMEDVTRRSSDTSSAMHQVAEAMDKANAKRTANMQKAFEHYNDLIEKGNDLNKELFERVKAMQLLTNEKDKRAAQRAINTLNLERQKNLDTRFTLFSAYKSKEGEIKTRGTLDVVQRRLDKQLKKLKKRYKRLQAKANALQKKQTRHPKTGRMKTPSGAFTDIGGFHGFELFRKGIRHGLGGAQGLEFRANAPTEYYYPMPVGRHGKKKGIHRGNPIMKTPTSGRQFATQSGNIFGGQDLKGAKQSSTTSFAPEGTPIVTSGKILGNKRVVGINLGNRNTFFSFNYHVNISYYGRNDVVFGWLSWREATNAFHRILHQEMLKFPEISSYFRSSTVISSPGARTTAKGGKFITYIEDLRPESESEMVIN